MRSWPWNDSLSQRPTAILEELPFLNIKMKIVLASCVSLSLLFAAIAPVAHAKEKGGPGVKAANPHAPAGTRIAGEIVTVGADKIVIRGNKGTEVELAINANTKFGKDKALSVGDFKKGDKVLIVFAEEDGRRVARAVVNVSVVPRKAVKGAHKPK